jgi:vacuolar protein sorting-associated protein 13A/C
VVKDLTVEAGSGLLVLEPVDFSWKYTSVSEKTNIILTSSEICIHLSLSVASLMLKLQNQTLAALQFGNINPLVSCTNFKRVWTSPEGTCLLVHLVFVGRHIIVFLLYLFCFFAQVVTYPVNLIDRSYIVGYLPGYNLTFWRPQAPSNYVILGDCVSSR